LQSWQWSVEVCIVKNWRCFYAQSVSSRRLE